MSRFLGIRAVPVRLWARRAALPGPLPMEDREERGGKRPRGPDRSKGEGLPAGREGERESPAGTQSTGTQTSSGDPRQDPLRIFTCGDLVAGRWLIVRFLARGGMGEVYEAEDLELGDRVALKTIRSDVAGSEATLLRFRRETQLARRITHPNVCRAHDLGRHRFEGASLSGEDPEVVFLTMELLQGETLADRLARTGPMTPEEALPLVRQMAGALAAAHEVGIVHRDFKPRNVMLVESGEGVRAVVTDFGLARSAGAGESLTGDRAAGTPAYMAPEQVEGGTITPATDVYALGLVLFEMMTGSRPFDDDSASSAIRRLREPPPSPRSRRAEVPERWETAILRCLEREPGRRFPSVRDVSRALAGEPTGAFPGRSRRRIALLVLAVAGLALPTGWFLLRGPAGAPGFSSVEAAVRPSVAVIGFRNLSGRTDTDWISTALSETVTVELASGGALRTVPGENVARMRAELDLPEADSFVSETLRRVREVLGTDYVVVGSYLPVGEGEEGNLRVNARIQEVQSGRVLVSVSESGKIAGLLDLGARTGRRLRNTLSPEEGKGEGAPTPNQGAPRTPEALRLYTIGLDRLRRFDLVGARESLEAAIASEPDAPLPHAALAKALQKMGYEARAMDPARRAVELAAGLPREQRLALRATFQETARDWAGAARTWRALWTFHPDDPEAGLRLAEALNGAYDRQGTLEVVQALRSLPPPAGDDPRIDLEAAHSLLGLDRKRASEALARAVRKADAQGMRYRVADALRLQSRLLIADGKADEALEALHKAEEIFESGGVSGPAAATLRQEGVLEEALGERDWEAPLDRALRLAGRVGALNDLAAVHMGLAEGRMARGDPEAAVGEFGDAVEILRDLGVGPAEASVLSRLARAQRLAGDIPDAMRQAGQALRLAAQETSPLAEGKVQEEMALLLLETGDAPRAPEAAEEAISAFREMGARNEEAEAHVHLGEVLIALGDLESARREFEASLVAYGNTAFGWAPAEPRLGIARLDLEEGRAGAAARAAGEAADVFDRFARPDGAVRALALLVSAHLAAGRPDDAAAALQRLHDTAGKTANPRAGILLALSRGRLLRAQRADGARQSLEDALAAARRLSSVPLRFEASIEVSRQAVIEGDLASAREQLFAAREEASARGYLLSARRAAEVLQSLPPDHATP